VLLQIKREGGNKVTDYRIPYYKWQAKLETNKKWTAAEVEAMFTELMEQCTVRMADEETIAELNKEIDLLRGVR
jgi:ssRNA-specific RNase YbeY (16S rRNA maturation enzyme)